MFFRQFLEAQSSTWTYLLADPDSREAAIIDPVLETVERDLKVLGELGFRLLWAIETHVHADQPVLPDASAYIAILRGEAAELRAAGNKAGSADATASAHFQPGDVGGGSGTPARYAAISSANR